MKFIAFLLLLSFSTISLAQEVIKLYPGKAPGSESWDWTEKITSPFPNNRILYNVTEPVLLYYPAPVDKANGTSIIVAPGGAFHILSIDNEGIRVAEWLNSLGISAFVLKYRLVKIETDNPFEALMPLMSDMDKLDSINAPVVELAKNDGIEAMKYVRTHAPKLGLQPSKIGFMGFSAGGTVTISVMLSAEDQWKPDFIAPIYLYKKAVLGKDMPIKETPIFIAVASDDGLGFVPHSIELYQEWLAAGQPAELHAYEKGDHGFGFAPKGTTSDMWKQNFENWLAKRKLIP
ncbi:alpha/beta hydrolase [Algoriphagus aestuariicola]|jgi:acetyl esterase/lipase|uniref:Alpha/beta hydrolase n=1 Tax=Algoriphagus aestuariicola TaxID=1852016 RepID=A0ABS3BMJ1_9BACT|nr:alpha/beta hydrolase [Algoriphagus aestuariicola]MBN7799560.1 alpha/beta hydrolase [Algoriphagus aestuariicola]